MPRDFQLVKMPNFLKETLWPFKMAILGLFFTGIVWGVTTIVTPYALKLMIDRLSEAHDAQKAVFAFVGGPVLIYLTSFAVTIGNFRFVDWIRLKTFPLIRKRIIDKYFAYLEGHAHVYFQSQFAGSLSRKITDMAYGTVEILSIIDDASANLCGILIAVGMLSWVNPLFGMVLLIWAISFFSLSLYFSRTIVGYARTLSESETRLTGKIVDSISNISNVRLFAGYEHENERIGQACTETAIADQVMQKRILIMRIWQDLSILFFIGSTLLVLMILYQQSKVTVGDFAFILGVSVSVFHSVWYLASQFVRFAEQWGRVQQGLAIIDVPYAIQDKLNAKELEVTTGQIEFKDVSFYFGEDKKIFKNKSVVLYAGHRTGLVGHSGAGKSSFVNLILRLFDVEHGEILIDGQNITQVTQESLHRNIAFIPQDSSLFHRSLLENIRYGRIDATDEEVVEAAKKAHCHEFISELAQGYHALVGERGIKLSGGQRQRIAIARAILKNAPILILDEATASLDSVTESYIQESLSELMQGRTTLVIAHRLSTLTQMDRILVFHQGDIIEEGTHDSLVAANGHYAHLWQIQAGGFVSS